MLKVNQCKKKGATVGYICNILMLYRVVQNTKLTQRRVYEISDQLLLFDKQ